MHLQPEPLERELSVQEDEVAHVLVREMLDRTGSRSVSQDGGLLTKTLSSSFLAGATMVRSCLPLYVLGRLLLFCGYGLQRRRNVVQSAGQQALVAKLEHERDSVQAELVATLAHSASLQRRLDAAAAEATEHEELREQLELAMEMLGERNSRVCASASLMFVTHGLLCPSAGLGSSEATLGSQRLHALQVCWKA